MYREVAGEGNTSALDDYKERLRYRNAAVQGDAKSQYELGRFYVKGNKVRQNYIEGDNWICIAARQGYVEAQEALGYYYSISSSGVEKDELSLSIGTIEQLSKVAHMLS